MLQVTSLGGYSKRGRRIQHSEFNLIIIAVATTIINRPRTISSTEIPPRPLMTDYPSDSLTAESEDDEDDFDATKAPPKKRCL